MNYKVAEEKPKLKTYTLGEMRELLKDLPDDSPIVAAPINESIRVALNIEVYRDASLEDYKGPIVVFSSGLFDINSGNEIHIEPSNVK